jgi:hypothetical protein
VVPTIDVDCFLHVAEIINAKNSISVVVCQDDSTDILDFVLQEHDRVLRVQEDGVEMKMPQDVSETTIYAKKREPFGKISKRSHEKSFRSRTRCLEEHHPLRKQEAAVYQLTGVTQSA